MPAILLHSEDCSTGKSTAISIATELHGQKCSVSDFKAIVEKNVMKLLLVKLN